MSRTRELRRGFSLFTLFTLLGATASMLNAQDPTPPAQATQTREHLVKKGDTLWDLARLYYGNPFLWPIIANANKPVVENPHWIYPVERLIIPGRDTLVGRPLGEPTTPTLTVSVVEPPMDPTPTVLGTPDMRRYLVSPQEYRTAPWLSENAQAAILGRLVRIVDASVGVTADKIPQQLYPNDRLLVGDIQGTHQVGDIVQIVRLGRGMGQYGRVVTPLGVMRIDSLGDHVVAGTLRQLFGTARVGDYIMSMGAAPELPRGTLGDVASGAEGKILEFLSTEPLYGPGDLAFISMGADQVRIGDELIVYIPAQKIDNERPDVVPATTVGVVRVVKVMDHSATVRVTGVRNTGLRGGLPTRLVRRAP